MNSILKLTALIALVLLPQLAIAQSRNEVSLFDIRMHLNRASESAALFNAPNVNEIRANYKGPKEPILPKTKFIQFDHPAHIQGQAESLMHGITIGLPPEYDHYGYELRRYMKSVGNFDIYKNSLRLAQERKNLEKARIISRYWRQKMNTDTGTLSKRIIAENADSKARTTYKLNSGILKAFTIEMQSWLNANEALLNFLAERQKFYKFDNGRIIFRSANDRAMFVSLYAAREKSRQQMHKYDPFKVMVY